MRYPRVSEARARRMVELYRDHGLSSLEVAERLGCSSSHVREVLARRGVPRRPVRPQWSADDLRAYILRRTDELGRPVRLADIIEDPDGPSHSIIDDVLGDGRETVTEIIARVLGVHPIDVHRDRKPREGRWMNQYTDRSNAS